LTDTETEREKYERMWANPGYRRRAPGMEHAMGARQFLNMRAGDSIYDWGCGTMRATALFKACGLAATGIDFARNASEFPGVPFIEACLWELPDMVPADWGFCSDVMEHIPPERVSEVLAGIAARTRRQVYFIISTQADRWGPKALGVPLHLTVKPNGWWIEEIRKAFPVVRTSGRAIIGGV
jgi:SAM-dependent methyltransferase